MLQMEVLGGFALMSASGFLIAEGNSRWGGRVLFAAGLLLAVVQVTGLLP